MRLFSRKPKAPPPPAFYSPEWAYGFFKGAETPALITASVVIDRILIERRSVERRTLCE